MTATRTAFVDAEGNPAARGAGAGATCAIDGAEMTSAKASVRSAWRMG